MSAPDDQIQLPPPLGERARGWLRFLWRKAMSQDDWSEAGEPHAWWDRYSTAPMLDFPRFDLSESAYALGLMSDLTPAWREAYGAILEQLVERHLTYWAAIDWLTHIGQDPRRGDYPKEWIETLIPPHLVGDYDVPGWCANGVEPWGLQPDPIGAEGNLFFKGWLNLTMSLHAYVSGEQRWTKPFEVAGVDGARFQWTQPDVAGILVERWAKYPKGPHCENTKVWPFCLSAAGLGLQLYDGVFGKNTHSAFETWAEATRGDYFGFDRSGNLEWTTFYYDPLIEHNHTLGPAGGLGVAFYLLPQDPAFAETLYRAGAARMGWDNPAKTVPELPDPRFIALGLALAREFGDETVFRRLSQFAEENFEPRAFGADGGEFGWWFQFGEDWPRGQLSALMAVAEVGTPGAWARLFREPDLAKFGQPTVEGVDYPALGLSRAWNEARSGQLHISTYCGESQRAGETTSFKISHLPDSATVKVRRDGAAFENWRALDGSTIKIETDINQHDFEVLTGQTGRRPRAGKFEPAAAPSRPSAASAAPLAVSSTARVQAITLPAGASCPCCVGL